MINITVLRIFMPVVMLALCGVAYAATGSEITSRAITKFGDSPSVKATFTITAGGHSSKGTITLSGDRFRMDVDGMQTWYDGRTQWTYSPSTGEVSVTEPTADELAQINPFAIVSSLRKGFTATLVKSTTAESIVHYKPHAAGGQGSLSVTYSNTTYWPVTVVVDSADGRAVIKIQSVMVGKTLHPSTFIYDKSAHPDAEIVDLR